MNYAYFVVDIRSHWQWHNPYESTCSSSFSPLSPLQECLHNKGVLMIRSDWRNVLKGHWHKISLLRQYEHTYILYRTLTANIAWKIIQMNIEVCVCNWALYAAPRDIEISLGDLKGTPNFNFHGDTNAVELGVGAAASDDVSHFCPFAMLVPNDHYSVAACKSVPIADVWKASRKLLPPDDDDDIMQQMHQVKECKQTMQAAQKWHSCLCSCGQVCLPCCAR